MTQAEYGRAILQLEYYGEKLGCKADFDRAIKVLRGWEQLKATITEIRDNNKCDHPDVSEICKFLLNYMNLLEEEVKNE